MRERKKNDACRSTTFLSLLLSHLLVARGQRRRTTDLPRGNRLTGAPQLPVLVVVRVETLRRGSRATTWGRGGNHRGFRMFHVLLVVGLLALQGLLQDLLPLLRRLQLRRQHLDILLVAVKRRLRRFHHSISHRLETREWVWKLCVAC